MTKRRLEIRALAIALACLGGCKMSEDNGPAPSSSSTSTETISAASAASKPPPRSPIVVKSGSIAIGKEFLVEIDPDDALLDARVDVGTLHHNAAGDAVVAITKWPPQPGFVADWNIEHPSQKVPAGSSVTEVTEVMCRPTGPIAYSVEQRAIGKDGSVLHRVVFDAATSREKAEDLDAKFSALTKMPHSYSSNWADLVCFAAASKCRGEDLVWPPPRKADTTSDPATRAAASNAQFVPTCRL